MEQKGVLEDEFQSYKNTIDIWKIQDAIGENYTITEERLEEYNLLFLDVSQIYREQNIYGDFLVPLAEEAEKINGKETECFGYPCEIGMDGNGICCVVTGIIFAAAKRRING